MRGDGPVTARLERASEDERGFVLVWFALVIIVLLAVAALAVDILVGYSAAQRVQNAADAGALAGVQFLPDDPTAAQAAARDVVKRNVDVADPAISFLPRPVPTQLEVQVRADVDTFFGKVLGVDSLAITRRAVAEYDPPVAMGSPFGTFGNTPGTGPSTQPWYWASVAGPLTVKGAGDAALSDWCDEDRAASPAWLGGYNWPVDNCRPGDENTDDHEGAQYFVVDKRNGAPLRVDVYDPAYIDTYGLGPDPACADVELLAVWEEEGRPDHLDPAQEEYCAGDQYVRFRGWDLPRYLDPVRAAGGADAPAEPLMDADGLANDTTFELFPPDSTPANPYDNETSAPVCGPATFEGHFNARLAKDAAADGSYATLHRWVPLCGAAGPAAPGKYVLKVSVAPGTHGHNRFALRAYASGAPFADTGVSVNAVDRMAVYTNKTGTTGEFFLARVPPSSVDRTLRVTLFDIGDSYLAGSGTTTVQIVRQPGSARPPAAAPVAIDGCRYTPPPGESGPLLAPWKPNAPAWGTPTATAPGCTITGVTRSAYNGQYVTIEVPIPAAPAYTCDATRPDECWLKIRFTAPATVTDTSTWVATLGAEPVRIIE